MCKAWDEMMEDERQIGREEGKNKGEARLSGLVQKLLKENRVDLINLVTQSEVEREQYYKKYEIC